MDFVNWGSRVMVSRPSIKTQDVECVNCGQCSAVCPTGALVVKSEIDKAWAALHDEEKLVVAQVAPAVRVALGEEFAACPRGKSSPAKWWQP